MGPAADTPRAAASAGLRELVAAAGGGKSAEEDAALAAVRGGGAATAVASMGSQAPATRLLALQAAALVCRELTGAVGRKTTALIAARQRLAFARWWPLVQGDRVLRNRTQEVRAASEVGVAGYDREEGRKASCSAGVP